MPRAHAPRRHLQSSRRLVGAAGACVATAGVCVATALAATAVVAAGLLAVVGLRAGGAGAVVRPAVGYRATVDGWTSWYGSYDMGSLGRGWCVDHGIASPDPDLGYVTTELGLPAERRTALAWLYSANGGAAEQDRVVAAAVMLAGHDLMDARYPSGTLRVDALSPTRLAGFGADADRVLAAARRLRADAVAHALLVGPLRLTVDRIRPGTWTARVTDAGGRPLAGVPLTAGAGIEPASATTGADGGATFRATGVEPPVAAISAAVPDLTLHAYRPTRGPAQRVAVPARGDLRTEGPGASSRPTLSVHKTGVVVDGLTLGGARFVFKKDATWGLRHEAVTGPDGRTEPVGLEPGSYEVDELVAPAGYATAGPWTVQVPASGPVVLDVVDTPLPRPVAVTKVDARTGAPVAGAQLAIRPVGGQPVASATSTAQPWRLTLPPGRYEVIETVAPAGYAALDQPMAFTVAPLLAAPADGRGDDMTVAVRVADVPLTTLAFAKAAAGAVDPAQATLAGATFVVRTKADPPAEVGRCTTAVDGRCRLPDHVVRHGAEVCWEEVAAPVGFSAAAGACLVPRVTDDGAPTTVTVAEPSRFTAVSGTKVGADGAPLAGAVYDLGRRPPAGGPALPAPAAPKGAAAMPDQLVWVGRATSAADGGLAFPLQVPGAVYCAVERTAPVGHDLAATPVCTDGPLVEGAPARLRLVDAATVVAAVPAVPAPPAVPVAPAAVTTTVPMRRVPVVTTAPIGTTDDTPPAAAVPTPPSVGTLPRTGAARVVPATILGVALVAAGVALVAAAPARRRRSGQAT